MGCRWSYDVDDVWLCGSEHRGGIAEDLGLGRKERAERRFISGGIGNADDLRVPQGTDRLEVLSTHLARADQPDPQHFPRNRLPL
jgi:hypothetical protein